MAIERTKGKQDISVVLPIITYAIEPWLGLCCFTVLIIEHMSSACHMYD